MRGDGFIINEIKGYVRIYNNEIPVTWARETRRYVYEVRTLTRIDGKWEANQRLFDDKIDKAEIIFLD